MLFQNYGLFWHKDRVLWGRPGRTGSLLGFRNQADGEVDFRYQRGVYVLYDVNFRLLYVGQAGYGNQRLYDRLHQHRGDHLAGRWHRFSWFGVDPVKGRRGKKYVEERDPSAPAIDTVLNHLEAILIASSEPPLNRQGGKFGYANAYRQSVWEGEDDDLTLRHLAQRLDQVAKDISSK